MAQTYYDILGVQKTATPEGLKAARNNRLRENHPDVAGDSHLERAKLINAAYATLKDPDKRAAYDRLLASGANNTQDFGFKASAAPAGSPFRDIANLFKKASSAYGKEDTDRPITYKNIFNFNAAKVLSKLKRDFSNNSDPKVRKFFGFIGAGTAVVALTGAMLTMPSIGILGFMAKTVGALGVAYTTGKAASLSRYIVDIPGQAAGMIGNVAARAFVAQSADKSPARQHLIAGCLTTAFAIAGSLGGGIWVADEAYDLTKQVISHDIMGYNTKNHSDIYAGVQWASQEVHSLNR